jgi:hypothetical protein
MAGQSGLKLGEKNVETILQQRRSKKSNLTMSQGMVFNVIKAMSERLGTAKRGRYASICFIRHLYKFYVRSFQVRLRGRVVKAID